MKTKQKTRTRKNWTADEKIEIIRNHFSKSKFVETCNESRVHPNIFQRWWKTVLEAGYDALSGDGKRRDRSFEKQLEKKDREILKKNEIIADLSGEVLRLKKQNGEI